MDLATVIGLVVGCALIVGSILMGGALEAFIHPQSMMIVFGGTIAATLTMESMSQVLATMKIAKNAFVIKGGDVTETVEQIVELSGLARRASILELENVQIEDEFLAKGIRMAVDGVPKEQIEEILAAEMVCMKQRHLRGQKLFKFMAATAPSMGMIGTLIGLVMMLRSLDDPATIGPSMAVALLTTFYGAFIAFVVCTPIALKLERRTQEESAHMKVVIEGVGSIVLGLNPARVKERLQAFVDPNLRTTGKKEAA